ncbi:MAG TPA: hypothetical protein VEI53_03705 [Ktedonobacteraceae bacterium]|nr:hypothetical protein [Ktedonobacteraceae bacterium]
MHKLVQGLNRLALAIEMVGHMQTPIPLYKPIQEVIKRASPRLILFSCPKEYGVDVKSQHDQKIHSSLYSYPIRGAAFTDPRNKESPSLLILPETPAMKETLKALEDVYHYYGIPTPEVIWGPDPVEPGENFGVFDTAVANQPEVIQRIASAAVSSHTIYSLISHAYTPETEQVCLAFEQAGIHVIPVFGPKDYGHTNAHDRSGSASFAEKYGLPYPFSRVGYTLSQIRAAYEEVAARTGNPLVFIKAAITGGGYFVEQVKSAEEALVTVRTWDTLGIREPIYDGEMIAVELQGTIPAIVAICSWQDAHGHITTPLRKDISATKGPAYDIQYLQGTAFAGNGYKVTLPIPEKALAKTETLIAIYQQRYLAALQQEPDYNPIDTGATDFAVVDLYQLSEHQARLILKEMWHIAIALDARYVPVGIERNGRRVSDAVPPVAFAELAGLEAGDHPLAAFKIEGISADPPAIVELLLKEKLLLDPKEGQSGLTPLALMYDPHRQIDYGSALVGAEREAGLFRAKDHVLERLEKAGFISRKS